MFGALAAAERLQLPTVALVHSAPGALMPPKGQFEALLLDPVNQVRMQAGLSAIKTLWQARARDFRNFQIAFVNWSHWHHKLHSHFATLVRWPRWNPD